MGLDLYVVKGDEDFFGERMSSYLSFHEFRKTWARLLGFDLEDMQGFGGTRPWTTEPLQCFFDHSDCEGEIAWQDAEVLLYGYWSATRWAQFAIFERIDETPGESKVDAAL